MIATLNLFPWTSRIVFSILSHYWNSQTYNPFHSPIPNPSLTSPTTSNFLSYLRISTYHFNSLQNVDLFSPILSIPVWYTLIALQQTPPTFRFTHYSGIHLFHFSHIPPQMLNHQQYHPPLFSRYIPPHHPYFTPPTPPKLTSSSLLLLNLSILMYPTSSPNIRLISSLFKFTTSP